MAPWEGRLALGSLSTQPFCPGCPTGHSFHFHTNPCPFFSSERAIKEVWPLSWKPGGSQLHYQGKMLLVL